jgi:cytochrome c553
MKRLELWLISLLLVVGGAGWAAQKAKSRFEDEEQYRETMHEIDHSFSTIAKHRNVRRGDDIRDEAEKLADLFADVESFWEGRGDEQAAGLARMAKEGAEAARDAATKHEQKALDAAIETIAGSCEGCHKEPLDKYRLPKK